MTTDSKVASGPISSTTASSNRAATVYIPTAGRISSTTDSNTANGPISSTTASSNRASAASANADNGRLISTGWSIEEQEARSPIEIGPTTSTEETNYGHEDPEDDQAFIRED
jgi:hypothetical protein